MSVPVRRGAGSAAPAALEDVWRREAPHVLAALLRRYSDLERCQDALQDAAEDALAWETDGVPDNPRGWLVRVASRRLIDALRSDGARRAREEADHERDARSAVVPAADETPSTDADDTLQLLLLCCHPSLSRSSQVALCLRSVGGLGVDDIAAAYLVPVRTMTQRLTRARATLREAGARFAMPSADELPDRVAAVLDACHLMFTAGYTRASGEALLDEALTAEAIRLVRQVVAALPDHDEAAGALALMLLTNARAGARTDGAGDLVPLAEQDRRRWARAPIAEGVALLERVLPRGPVGRYQLTAAIAAVHDEAATWEDTDWPQICELYAMLTHVAPSPVVTLNRAVAVAMVDGPGAGLAMLEDLRADAAMRDHHRLHAVRAHLLEEAGDLDGARESYARAAQLTRSVPEQRYLNRRLAAL
ncbi:putative RNA polymerase, sigma-24 subunit, ECF subfamily [Beutenbergia cavernae DSM 12333]|uniref:Putative RNA polymerase, sigma-24 subunit, ECF subfamily n=1 Tax=Beutenbergia cavernae (strain ATCC BAA-8 / DSM 12333 / CCUG 43141 / JCM 11478 / NBRC 16432 / NCIMB 13614 / HKI 0122) TaxID=471853 RepID=C5BWI8_BEUC1|nr:DUF6596 domain-containing protein [Beutenbergia cavernae]ACQ78646.1 putative RNA polymerase, sigma-24 subunit, ECF subfamily [Beutenbergia cavernae DSM 12333]